VLLIVDSPADALALVEAGLEPLTITVGGLHHKNGKERLLDYVYVDDGDRTALRQLADRGIAVVAQDVPRHGARDLKPLLSGVAR
jgi:mannose/fructose/N-acetylgalactosamine-specific phosphotransferase system component IIB